MLLLFFTGVDSRWIFTSKVEAEFGFRSPRVFQIVLDVCYFPSAFWTLQEDSAFFAVWSTHPQSKTAKAIDFKQKRSNHCTGLYHSAECLVVFRHIYKHTLLIAELQMHSLENGHAVPVPDALICAGRASSAWCGPALWFLRALCIPLNLNP